MDAPFRPSFARRLFTAALCTALFFAVYCSCGAFTASRPVVPTAFLVWDYRIPLIPWTIVPYWSLDLLVVAAFLVAPDARALRVYTARVLVGVAVACVLFVLFPLRCDAGPLADAGVWTPWFHALGLFDTPFNQAPSLHIILLIFAWRAHLPVLARRWRPLACAWGALIAVSTLTTRQHGLVDVISGVVVGLLIVRLIRAEPVIRRKAR